MPCTAALELAASPLLIDRSINNNYSTPSPPAAGKGKKRTNDADHSDSPSKKGRKGKKAVDTEDNDDTDSVIFKAEDE